MPDDLRSRPAVVRPDPGTGQSQASQDDVRLEHLGCCRQELEFEIPPDVEHSSCFVGDRSVERLEESPVECTTDYQGFRRTGLLWIDCPGVLSGTFANADLARRLVRRADLVVLVSSSDAPFKRTEMAELVRLIRESGNQRVEAILVVSKFDVFDETVDPRTGRITKSVRRKDRGSETGQTVWCREELESTGLLPYIRNPEPIPLSVYLARQALGRRWIDGRRGRSPSADGSRAYEVSGVPAFLARLAVVVRTDGAAIKAAWPAKRRQALKAAVDAVCDRSEAALAGVADRFRQERTRLAAARKPACDEAAEAAAASVAAALKKSGADDPAAFDQAGAERRLREALVKAVRRALDRHVQPILASIGAEIDAAMKEYAGRTRFDVSVQTRFVTRTYTSTAKGEGWGAGIGGGAGGYLGFELGVALGSVLGPVGSLVGGLLFGLVGAGLLSTAGRWFGRELGGQTRTVRVAAGTNADEVVAGTAREMGDHAARAVGEALDLLDRTIFGQILGELSRLGKNVGRWRRALAVTALVDPRSAH
ncbi:MAG: hypothetical protein HY905_16890 [Deltaproteobacteria bacterium]|nr:hypothetical protein [Deltaproteobacteria bacterium]